MWVLRKREGLLQCVYEEGVTAIDLKELKEGAAIEVSGVLNKEERAPGGFEIRMKEVKILPSLQRVCRFQSQSGR